jgi:cell surface protein SprA
LRTNSAHRLCVLVAAMLLSAFISLHAQANPPKTDTTKYPVTDRKYDPYTDPNRNPFGLSDTGFVKRSIEYDPKTGQYYIVEKIGNQYYRTPATFSMKEFLSLQGSIDEKDYFRQRANMLSNLNRRGFKPKFPFSKDWVNRITGNGKVEIRPTGYVDIMAGYQGQYINNPTLPERARKTGGFDFNQNAQLQVDAKIGDKIQLPINYNTLANFDFENQLKFDYQGKEDEILKRFQAGTVSWQSKGTLIPSVQSLFGISTQLQFGKLFITGALANQRSNRQSVGLQGGAATQQFSLKADDYEENRHFLLSQYFRGNFNKAMKRLPVVESNVQIQRVEVWVTNRTGATTDTRDIVGFMDLGEAQPFNTTVITGIPNALPANNANNLFSLINTSAARNSSDVQSFLTSKGLQPVQDFEKTFARKLLPTDYYFNPQIGFISLNQQLQPDEVLGVAFQYTYNGRIYQVGEFSQDVPPSASGDTTKVLFLKLLKATSQRVNLPLWELMMKNVYSVGFGQLSQDGFDVQVTYEEPSKGDKRYLPDTDIRQEYAGVPILQLVNLDRLNNQRDPLPDGKFDYLEGYTVISPQSRIIFPVLEPFGDDLEYVYPDSLTASKYLFYPLYDTIKAIASNFANLNRFKIVGRSKSAVSGDYQLGFNIPRGSVTVNAGGQVLVEGIDYEINYDLGSLRIINQAILNANLPVQIGYENNATFGLQQKNFLGLRLDYLHNKHLTLGATMVRLGERPFFSKQTYGEDPIRNTMYGADFDYRNDFPKMTKWLNKLPFYSTKAMSSITAYGEAALLQPGHAKEVDFGEGGVSYIDDFEGTRSSIDLRFPLISWTLASVPQNSPDLFGNPRFPEALFKDSLASGYNRAKLAWYNIEPVLQEKNNSNNPLGKELAELSKPETRRVLSQEIFPQRTNDFGQGIINTFDLAFYPREKGPYNYQPRVNPATGELLRPDSAWGGLMRNVDQTDFETNNIEFIEFWLLDPFTLKPNSTGGQLIFNLGNISEDILRDGKRQYENGLPTPAQQSIPIDETRWAKVPRNPIQVTNAFSNDPADRPYQDIGYDGSDDTAERRKFTPYLNQLGTVVGTSSATYQRAANDPSADNFKGYRDPSFSNTNGILERYKNINSPHGNSPIASTNDQFTNAFTLYPDGEELNHDNTLNEVEEYFQYHVQLKPNMQVGSNFITDKREVNVRLADNSTRREIWYLFRIPIKSYQAKVGNIPDFKSIRFIRMFMSNFNDTAVLRFAKLELIRNQWRKLQYKVDTTGQVIPLPANDPTTVDILAVNIEENDRRQPIPYRQPPGIERQQQISNNNVQLLLNEQSLSVKVCDLFKKDARGVFKSQNLNLTQYGKLSMFIHAESSNAPGTDLATGDINAVIRIGNDYTTNYYEVKIPLKITPWGATDSLSIWPEQNNLELDLKLLPNIKSRRNKAGGSPSVYYSELINGKQYAIIGNPNLGEVRGIFLGVENPVREVICAELWYNELRLSQLDEESGYAALGRVAINLADLGNVNFTGNVRSIGFGSLEQKVNERNREHFEQYDISTSLELGKLLPKSLALTVPMYASVSKTTSTPEFDPYDLDIKLKDKMKDAPNHIQDSIRNDAVSQRTIKTINFTGVKRTKTFGEKPQVWDLSNFDINYNYTHDRTTTPIIEYDDIKRTRVAVGYGFAPQPTYIEPFKNLIKSKSAWFALIRDFNFNFKPRQISLRGDVLRHYGVLRNRNVGAPKKLPENFDKYFLFDRYFTLGWDLTKSISLDFNAVNNARVDEPYGRLDTEEKLDSVKKNFWKGGRNTHYHHDITMAYTLPTAKLPLLDWTQIRASYKVNYDWLAGTLLARELGNTLYVGQSRNVTGDLDFDRLYNKSRYLQAINSDAPAPPKEPVPKNDTTAKKKRGPGEPIYISPVPKFFLRMLTSVKRVGIQYSEDFGTLLPGYMDSTRILGMNPSSGNPGWKYSLLGYQPDTTDINNLAARGVLSSDSLFNALIQQRYTQSISLTAQIIPIRDLNIDLTLNKTFSKDYSELQKDTGDNVDIKRYNPYATGSFSISYIANQTLFSDFDPNEVSALFKQFEANRIILSQRLGSENPYANPGTTVPGGYVKGYDRYAQDVLIPAFIAAYTKKDPTTVPLVKNSNPNLRSNPFSAFLPKPNWNITYNGLTRLPGLEKIFTNFTLRHGYNGTLSMNSFTTALLFQDPFRVGYPSFIDTNNNFIPYYLVPNVTINEQYSPLIAADMTFTNQMSVRFEYRKTRTLSLSLIDYQLAENRSVEITFGLDWRRKGFPFLKNLKIGKNAKPLDNDVTIRMDFSIRDDGTSNSKLDQNTAFGTAGQRVVRIAPSVDYVVNNRINLKFYFEQNRVIPKIATTAPVTNTRAGVQVRISLAQ